MSIPASLVKASPRVADLFAKFAELGDPSVSAFASSFPERFEQVVSHQGLRTRLASDFVLQNRIALRTHAEAFHRDAGTLGTAVSRSLELLSDPTTRIVVSTHQPNLFPYGGVFRKIVLMENLRNQVQSAGQRPVVNLFLLVDHDFLDETWIRTAQLPSISHAAGVLELRLPVGESRRWQLVCNAPVPPKSTLNHWKHQVRSWIKSSTAPASRARADSNGNFESFWQEIVEPAYARARTLSDLNAFVSSRLVNSLWGYGTLYVRLSQLAKVFENGFTFLLSNHAIYSDAIRGIEARLMSRGIDTGVGASSHLNAPVWLHCPCGSKASARVQARARNLWLAGECMGCKKSLELDLGAQDNLDLSRSSSKLSPRAIPIPLLLARDLGVTCYASGTGGIGYLVDASVVAKKLGIEFPMVAVWSSRDRYTGIGQCAAVQDGSLPDALAELRSLEAESDRCRDRLAPLLRQRDECIKDGRPADKVLSEIFAVKNEQRAIRQRISQISKSSNTARLSPCFIDYAVNFGAARTEKIWSAHLLENGSLAGPIVFP